MSLLILHNRAEHTHENQQFRRISYALLQLFEQRGWTGVFIGNPFNEQYSRFRADAILYYNNGLWLIDFKDYSGIIQLPPSELDFMNLRWYAESEIDKSRIEVKAGSKFINPYRQLKSYRQAFYEVVETNGVLRNALNPSHVCAANILTGPVDIKNKVPKTLPYYKILQESELAAGLYDYASSNTFDPDIAEELKRVFPATNWEEPATISGKIGRNNKVANIADDIAAELDTFLTNENQILVLQSMDQAQRDGWMQYIYKGEHNFNGDIHLLAHSSRIAKKIKDRTQLAAQSIYATIYGGPQTATASA
jgi:hypothetical protein